MNYTLKKKYSFVIILIYMSHICSSFITKYFLILPHTYIMRECEKLFLQVLFICMYVLLDKYVYYLQMKNTKETICCSRFCTVLDLSRGPQLGDYGRCYQE